MSNDKDQALKVLGIYFSFTIGLIIIYVINTIDTDDIGIQILFGLSIASIPTLLLVISALTSHSIGNTCEYRLQGAIYSGGINSVGVLVVVTGLAIIGANLFGLVLQIVFATFVTGFIASMSGSIGTNIPFSSSDFEETDFQQKMIEPPDRSTPSAYSKDGYEWIHLEDGTTWYRFGGGFPDPNTWNLHQPEWSSTPN